MADQGWTGGGVGWPRVHRGWSWLAKCAQGVEFFGEGCTGGGVGWSRVHRGWIWLTKGAQGMDLVDQGCTRGGVGWARVHKGWSWLTKGVQRMELVDQGCTGDGFGWPRVHKGWSWLTKGAQGMDLVDQGCTRGGVGWPRVHKGWSWLSKGAQRMELVEQGCTGGGVGWPRVHRGWSWLAKGAQRMELVEQRVHRGWSWLAKGAQGVKLVDQGCTRGGNWLTKGAHGMELVDQGCTGLPSRGCEEHSWLAQQKRPGQGNNLSWAFNTYERAQPGFTCHGCLKIVWRVILAFGKRANRPVERWGYALHVSRSCAQRFELFGPEGDQLCERQWTPGSVTRKVCLIVNKHLVQCRSSDCGVAAVQPCLLSQPVPPVSPSSLPVSWLTFLRMRAKCKIINVQRNDKAFMVKVLSVVH